MTLAVGFGGNVFQMVVVDPVWSASPPESLHSYFGDTRGYEALKKFHINPFFAFAQLCLLAGVFINWRETALRRWLLAALIIQVVIVAGTLLYVYPINDSIMIHAGREVSASRAVELTRQWLIADRVRLVLKFFVLVSVFRALQCSGARSPSTIGE